MTTIQHTFIQSELEPRTYIPTVTSKSNIVLHNSFARTKYTFTESEYSESYLVKKWNIMADKYSGHYIVGRGGVIHECLNEEFWANHLALPKKLNDYNKKTISVFLCNEAYLLKENGCYYAFGIKRPHNTYKGPIFEKTWMGHQYWADYEKMQIKRLISLLKDICVRNNLPLTMYKNLEKYNLNSVDKATIVSCANLNNSSFSLTFPDWVLEEFKKAKVEIVD
jgi:N-acetyl-anhydromuramyl-L-alanine amidase AmpD